MAGEMLRFRDWEVRWGDAGMGRGMRCGTKDGDVGMKESRKADIKRCRDSEIRRFQDGDTIREMGEGGGSDEEIRKFTGWCCCPGGVA